MFKINQKHQCSVESINPDRYLGTGIAAAYCLEYTML